MRSNDLRMGVLSLLAPNFFARMQEAEKREEEQMFAYLQKTFTPRQWDEDHTGFDKNLYLDAASWSPVQLFDTPPMKGTPGERMSELEKSRCVVWSPTKRFFYANHTLPKGAPLPIFQGRKRGRVFFSDDIISPVLCEVVKSDRPRVWMGITPMEMLTQRRGVMLATARVVVGGLGLGWFLNKVASKKSVDEVVVVDKEQELLDWLRPRMTEKYPALATKVSGWVCDDIYEFMAKDTEADRPKRTKYLLDIWESYGGVDGKFYEWKKKLGNRIWGWGDVTY